MDQLFYMLALIVCGAAALRFAGRRLSHGKALTAQQLQDRLQSGSPVTLLDVRTPEEYQSGHIPTARNLPLSALGAQSPLLPSDQEAEIVVYCRSGQRSARAAGKLSALGYSNVYDLGGIQDWPYETTVD